MKSYFIFLLAFLSFRCMHSGTTEHYPVTDSIAKKADTLVQHKMFDKDWEEEGKRQSDTNYKYLDRILATAVNAALQHKNDKLFAGTIDTSVYHFKDMYATFELGNIFSTGRKHLLVKRFINEYGAFETSLYADIYLLKGNRFVKLVSDTADTGYTDDALEDINLDGFKDFIISQYSGAGCCPRDDRKVYLYNNSTGGFETTGLFNPEFDNKNKLVYEMDYGHPGEVSISKSRWKGVSKIVVESISPTHFEYRIDSFVKPYSYTKTIYPSKKEIILNAVPEEYRKLKNFEYFKLYQE